MGEAAVSPSLGALLRHVRGALERAGKPDAALEARLIVGHATGTGRSEALLDPGRAVPPARMARALAVLERRLAGEPVHRIIGERAFYGLRLKLSPATLEPRPDTEALVDLALPRLRTLCERHGGAAVLDLGTGTGAVALALVAEEPRAIATATDIAAEALATAAGNADMNGLGDRFRPVLSDWYGGVSGRFHMIVSNPPYIASSQIGTLEREVRDHDPRAALDGGDDGLDAYRAIAAGAGDHLAADGLVAVEIGYDQGETVPAIFGACGFRLVEGRRDLAGTLRALMFDRQAS